jgi:small-conductance mechanosensitive channel
MILLGVDISDYGSFAAFILGGLVVGWVFERIIARTLGHSRLGGNGSWLGVVKGLGHTPMLWFALLGAFAALEVLQWSDRAEGHIRKAMTLLVIVTVTLVVTRIATSLANAHATRLEGTAAASTIFLNIARGVVVLIGIAFVLNTLGVEITPILTALGVGGLAVALALQDTLGNLFSGLQIISGRLVRVGDFVELSSGQSGFVEDITWRYTTIRQLANNLVVVPNATLANSIFTNYKLPAEELSILVNVGVAYATDLELAERIAKDVARETVAECAPAVVDFEPFARFHTA